MLKKMERRFTIVAISVISLVLFLLVLAVQLISAQVNVRKADMILSTMAEENTDIIIGNMGSMDLESLRSFSVAIRSEDDALAHEINGIGFVDEAVASALAKEVSQLNSSSGFIEEYRYLLVVGEDVTNVYFLDYSFESESARNFLVVSVIVYLLSVLFVAILVRVFMKFVMKPIRESYERQKQFITDASHELKTPLTVISTNMQLIEMEAGPSKWVKSVNKQVERLTMLSNDLVELSRMDEASTQVILSKMNLSDLVWDVVYGFEPAISVEGKTLQVNIEDGISIDGDYDGLEKVVSILLENALKYTSKEGSIWLKLWKNHKAVTLSVENTVVGMNLGDYNEYFERFYRADKSRNSKTGGFGIGLAVAKSVVEHHGGTIEAHCLEEDRITFTVNL